MSQPTQKQRSQQQLHLQTRAPQASTELYLSEVSETNGYNTNGTISSNKPSSPDSDDQSYQSSPTPTLNSTPPPLQLSFPQPPSLQPPQVLSVRVPVISSQPLQHQQTNRRCDPSSTSSTNIDLESQRLSVARFKQPQLVNRSILTEYYQPYHPSYHYYQFPQAPPPPLPPPPPPHYYLPTTPTHYHHYATTNQYLSPAPQYYTYQNGYNNINTYNGQATYHNHRRAQSNCTLLLPQLVQSMSIQPVKSETKAETRLIWLLFMHRHGDRAPLNMAPRDKYNDIAFWPEGFGNLNNAGRLRMYKLGKFIRQRYGNFLTDNIREVYSRSSDVDRCIESSHAVLAGLYEPSARFEWNKDLKWVPAPVHTVPAPDDYLLNEAGRKFLIEFINEIHLVQNSEAVKNLYAESVEERELLERELGYDYDMFYKFKCTYSTLDIEERNGLPMPSWYTPELKQKLYRFAGIAFGLAGGGTEKLKKIRCGNLLDDIVNRMEMSSITGPQRPKESEFHQPTNSPTEVDDRKIVHYSTHDSIMAAFLEALNINTPMPVPPGFGATFFIELYVDLNEQGLPVSEKYIKLFYMDDTDSEKPVEKKLPSCRLNEKGQLTLNNFKKYVANLLPNNAACNLTS